MQLCANNVLTPLKPFSLARGDVLVLSTDLEIKVCAAGHGYAREQFVIDVKTVAGLTARAIGANNGMEKANRTILICWLQSKPNMGSMN
jgi:hypothetical protein